MVAPSLCGSFLSNKRSMVAFTWTITTVMTLVAFFTAIVLILQIHTHYRKIEHYYQTDEYYEDYYAGAGNGENQYNQHNRRFEEGGNKNEGDGNGGGDHNSGSSGSSSQDGDGEYDGANSEMAYAATQKANAYLLLAKMSAPGITFVALYTMFLAVCLSMYGSTAIVGFTSLRGVYIAPCFSSDTDNLKIGIFGGAIVVFANLLIVCAVILGELRVEDFQNYNRDDMEPYQVERIATVLAVTCMFLSALYTIFAVLLFLCYASDEKIPGFDQEEYSPAVVSVHHSGVNPSDRPRSQRGFISMESAPTPN